MSNKSGVARQGLNSDLFAKKTYVDGAIIDGAISVSPNSSQYIDITNNEISIKSLTISNIVTDTSIAVDFSTWYSNNFTTLNSVSGPIEMSDILLLTAINNKSEMWIHNGGSSLTVLDFTQIQNDIDDAFIKSSLSSTNGIIYDSLLGEFKLGGNLTENTTITTSSNDFYIGDGGDNHLTFLGTGINTFSGLAVVINGTSTTLQGGNSTIVLNDTDMIVTDTVNSKGLEYATDYSTNFTDNSLITKKYVDDEFLSTINFPFNLEYDITGVRFDFLTGNYGINLNVPLFSIRNETNVDLINTRADLLIGAGNLNGDIQAKSRNIIGHNNINLDVAGEDIVVVGSNNTQNSNGDKLVIIGNNNQPIASSGEDILIGNSIFSSVLTSGGFNIALGTSAGGSFENVSFGNNLIGTYVAYGGTGDLGNYNNLIGAVAYSVNDIGNHNNLMGYLTAENVGSINDRNTLIGPFVAQNTNSIEDNNVLIGPYVAQELDNMTNYNTFIGYRVARNGTGISVIGSNEWNTGIGAQALSDADFSTLDLTTSVGASSMRYGGGESNTSVGRASGWDMKGEYNTALGGRSGKSSDSNIITSLDGASNGDGTKYEGQRSTFIGYDSGYDSTIATQSDINVFGSYTATEGTSTYIASRENLYLVSNTNGIENKLKIPNISANPGQVLSDELGNGELGWKDIESHLYVDVIFLDSSASVGTGQIGNIDKPYASITDASASNGGSIDGFTFYCLSDNCVGSVVSDNATIIGNGFTSSVSNGGGRTVTVKDIIMSSGQHSGGTIVSFYNCIINDISYAFGGSSLYLYDCIVNAEMGSIKIAKNCTFNNIVNYNGTLITTSIFNSYLILSDRSGGIINDNIFNTPIADVPIQWGSGFNSSQSGGKITVSNNLFNTDNNLIIEDYLSNNTASMKMEIFSNRFKGKFNYSLTYNELIVNFDNETIENKGFIQSNTTGTFIWDSRETKKSITLVGNTTLDITNSKNGDIGTIVVKQDVTGGRTLTLPINSIVGNSGSIDISNESNNVDILEYWYDGTDYIWTYGYTPIEKTSNYRVISSSDIVTNSDNGKLLYSDSTNSTLTLNQESLSNHDTVEMFRFKTNSSGILTINTNATTLQNSLGDTIANYTVSNKASNGIVVKIATDVWQVVEFGNKTETIFVDHIVDSDSPVSLSNVYKGLYTIDVLSIASSPKLLSVSYMVSLDDETFITQSDISDVQIWLDNNVSVSTIWSIKTVAVYVSGKIGSASTQFKMNKII